MLESGVAKECARMVLPLATPTRIYMTGSCRSWIHYINLRSAHGTQKEHMAIAEECRELFVEQFPTVSEALGWKKRSLVEDLVENVKQTAQQAEKALRED